MAAPLQSKTEFLNRQHRHGASEGAYLTGRIEKDDGEETEIGELLHCIGRFLGRKAMHIHDDRLAKSL